MIEMPERYTIDINNEIYCDEFGNPYWFTSYEDAQEFIEYNGLWNADVVRQY